MNVEFALKLRIYRSLKSLICLKWIRKKLSTTLHTQFNLTLHSRSLPLNLWEMRMHMHVHVFRTKNRHRSTVKAQEWLKKQTHMGLLASLTKTLMKLWKKSFDKNPKNLDSVSTEHLKGEQSLSSFFCKYFAFQKNIWTVVKIWKISVKLYTRIYCLLHNIKGVFCIHHRG